MHANEHCAELSAGTLKPHGPNLFGVGTLNSNQLAFVWKYSGKVSTLPGQQKGWCFLTRSLILDTKKRFYKCCSKCCDGSGITGTRTVSD